MAKKLKWQVRIGPTESAQFTHARPLGDPVQLIGSVKGGMQFGALALIEGKYFQVNGDHTVPLNFSQISRAITKAPPVEDSHQTSMQRRPAALAAPAPTVTVKRRRLLSIPGNSMA